MGLDKVRIIELPKILDQRGNLTFVQNGQALDFLIRRVFWIYDVPGGEVRGGHAYREQKEVIIALSGSFIVSVFDGFQSKEFLLNRSYSGLFIPNLIWRQMKEFSTNSLAVVISSHIYNEHDYIRDLSSYKDAVKNSAL